MKKLMVLVAAFAMALASQAATFKWTGANIYDHTGSAKYTGTAAIYAFLSTATAADAVKVVDVGVNAGTIKDGATTGYTYNWTTADVGSTYNFFMVIEDGDYTLDTSAITPALIKQGVAFESQTTTVGFANMATATGAGNWVGGAAPEPTSGLLLLLGMAGLALKRKIA